MADTSLSYAVIMLTVMSHIERGEASAYGRLSRCGERPAANESINYSLLSRIVGGTSAKKEECPWIASLKKDGKHFCGATIISENRLVTAAHCLLEKNIEFYMKVFVGDYDFNIKESTEQSFHVQAVHKHPDFNSKQPYNNDVAVVEVVGRITFGKYIQPACLPSPDEEFPKGYMCDTLGWGRLEENGKLPNMVHRVSLPIIEYKRCISTMKTVDQRLEFNTVVCAGYPEGGKDACQGDSGGPFLCQRSHGRWVLVGVTSWGLGCARKWIDNFLRPPDKRGSPGIFTDIQRLRGWIITKLNQEDPHLPVAQVRCSSTDGLLRGTAGEITHPRGGRRYYSNNENCDWRIQVPEGNHILLRFHRFSVEWDYSCDLDYLGVYTSSGRLIGKFCGDVQPRPLLIPDRNITVKFFSDFQEYRSGFSFSYEAVEPNLYPDSDCGSVPVIFEEGEIQTMNHPEPYSSNAICQWVVHCPSTHRITLNFVTFDLESPFAFESHEECIFDYVVVHHDLQGNMQAGKFCGFSIPDPIVSVSNVMQITFISDYAANYIGFRAVISFVLSKSRNINPETEEIYQPQKSQDAEENGSHVSPKIQRNSQPQGSQQAAEDVNHVCGVPLKPPRFNSRSITTAEEAMPNSWPWHVSVSDGKTHLCHGAIVSEYSVLTSANCVAECKSHDVVMIKAGIHDLEVSLHAQKRQVKQVILHPEKNYHVALIHVDEPFRYSPYVQPVCLPDAHSTLEPSDLCVVTGWSLNEELSTKLQQQEVPIVLDDICKKRYTVRTDTMFCAGPVAEKHLAQSGAPLVRLSNKGNFLIYGVDIGDIGFNKNPKPGVYSRVPMFSQWIRERFLSAHDCGFQPQDALIPPDQRRSLQSGTDRPAADDSGSAQDIYVPWKDDVSLQSPGKIKLVAGGQDSPDCDRCQVVFRAPHNHNILLNLMQLSASCDHCSLMIYEGESGNKTFKAQLTKENIPITIKFSVSAITIVVGGSAQGSELQLWLSYSFHEQK
ncbi:ovochymase-2-like [Dendrobates tinctorius]|uniref:ovochymase-2-like n=1 Tax=Dendrobates tinctorius TaxID=92724 RepID=UPI003CC92F3F